MPDAHVIVDCSSGTATAVPLTQAELDAAQAAQAAALLVEQEATAAATAAAQAKANALAALQAVLPNLGPSVAQGQVDAANYPAAAAPERSATVQRLITNTILMAEAVGHLLTYLELPIS